MKNKPLRIVVCGASGRMGARVTALAKNDRRFLVAARVSREEFPTGKFDAFIDFSAPDASIRFAAAAANAGVPIVIGTTGFSKAQLARLKAFSRQIPVFLAPNFSPAVSVLMRLSAEASRSLKGFEASISETHHKLKKDAPSGTALRLAEVLGRGKIPIASRREGDVVGEHTLTLAGPFERLELTHRAASRDVFARGALDAALWLFRKRPGLYGMSDLIKPL